MSQKTLRIFISSPSDVQPERVIAQRVVERLDREFSYHFRIEPYMWEREPLIATEHFQTMIVPPSETDIVVAILWSRLGSPLPPNEFQGAVSGKRPVTGTEWEFEDAVKGYRQHGKPDLLMYRKQAKVTAELDDREALQQMLVQQDLVEAFMKSWFMDDSGGSFKAASHTFDTTTQFEEMLEIHLRGLLKERLELPEVDVAKAGIRWHEGSPYRGLESFELKHSPVFFGRTRAGNELREVLVRRATQGCAFVMVLGASGIGKSSLVKAGLLRDLITPGMVDRLGLCRYAILRPSDHEYSPVHALAKALLSETALPELKELEYDQENLMALLIGEAKHARLPIQQGLAKAREKAQLTRHAVAKLAVIVDQFEELFTLDWLNDELREMFVTALSSLAKSGLVYVVATMRSDFFDKIASLSSLVSLTSGEARYLLSPPNSSELGRIIRQPALEAGLRFEVDEKKGISLDEEIRHAAAKDPSALPLLEYTLTQLSAAKNEQGVLTYKAYERLGGLEGGLGRRAEEVYSELPNEVKGAFPAVLRALVTVDHDTGKQATARRVSLATFPEGTPQRRLVEAFLSPGARLLVAEGGEKVVSRVRVAHEALLMHWQRAEDQIETDRNDLLVRGRLEESARRWREAEKQEKKSLLLPPGLPLKEGKGLLMRWEGEVESEILAYVSASVKSNIKRKVGLAMVLVIVGLGAGIGIPYGQRMIKEAAESERLFAIEGSMEFVQVPSGCFMMGALLDGPYRSRDNRPHDVCVDSFEMAKYEVTGDVWKMVMDQEEVDKPHFFGGDHPAGNVSWFDAQDFIDRLNVLSEQGGGIYLYRLPTEAEWEYACKSDGPKEGFCGGDEDEVDELAWHKGNSGSIQPVGKKKPNGWGLYDMSGNAWEWVQDWYEEKYYTISEKSNPKGPKYGSYRIIRGGSADQNLIAANSANRTYNNPGNFFDDSGFRLVRQPK